MTSATEKHDYSHYNNKSSKVLLAICWALLSLFGLYLVFNLYVVTVKEHEEHAKAAGETQWKLHTYSSDRGVIYDANMNPLASNTLNYTIVCTPKNVVSNAKKDEDKQTREQIIDKFVEILGVDRKKIEESIPVDPKDTSDPLVKVGGLDMCRNVTKEQKEKLEKYVKKHSIGGITFVAVNQRYYNNGEFASQIIGYARNDGSGLQGVRGLEAYYNDLLSGTNGYRYAEVDARTEGELPYSEAVKSEAANGRNLVLNLDMRVQQLAENACKDAYEKFHPEDGVCAIVMNPNTGAVLAMVSMPDYDLNDPYGVPFGMDESIWKTLKDDEQIQYLEPKVWKNRCITDTYEPGSTFKAITTAIAFDENLSNEGEMLSDEPIRVSDVDTIKCWRSFNHGTETLTDAFKNSCNPIFVQLARRIGKTKYYKYVHTFGFYEKTGIDLPAEGTGIFHSDPSDIDMACLSFGESATVTPIQLLNSYCAIINGGKLMVPHIVKYVTDSDGNVVDEIEPEVIRTVLSSDTSARVRALMEQVVEGGTGKNGRVPGYSVAGKTSTSTIELGGGAKKHVVSFSCFAPSYDPQIAVLVVINKPDESEGTVGSSEAAKVAAKIVEGTLTTLGVPRIFNESEYKDMLEMFYVPKVNGYSAKDAAVEIGDRSIAAIYGSPKMNSNSVVGFTYPSYDKMLYTTGVVVMYPEGTADSEMLHATVPNLKGKSAVECIQALRDRNLNCRIVDMQGNTGTIDSALDMNDVTGVCVDQSVGAGESVLTGEIIEVRMKTTKVITPSPTPPPEDDTASEDGVQNAG